MILDVCCSIGSTRDSFISSWTILWGLWCYHPHWAGWGDSHMEWGAKSRSRWDMHGAISFSLLSPAYCLLMSVSSSERLDTDSDSPCLASLSQVPYIIDTLEAERIAVFHAWCLQLYGLMKDTEAWHIAVEFEWSEAFGCLALLSSIIADCQVNHVAKSATTATASRSAQSGFRLEHILTWKIWQWRSEGSLGSASKHHSLAIHRSWNFEMCMAICTPRKTVNYLTAWGYSSDFTQHTSGLSNSVVPWSNTKHPPTRMKKWTNQVMLSNRIKELLEHMKDVKELLLQRCCTRKLQDSCMDLCA